MARTTMVFYADALAANPTQGLDLVERANDVPESVKRAVRGAFEDTSGDAEQRATEAATRLLASSDERVQAMGRLLRWAVGNFRPA